MSKGLGSMQIRLLDELDDRQQEEAALARAGLGWAVELLGEDGWAPVADLVGPTHSEQESARRAAHRLEQQGYVELRRAWHGNPQRLVLLVRLLSYVRPRDVLGI